MLPLHEVTGRTGKATYYVMLYRIVHNIYTLSNEDTNAMMYAEEKYVSIAGLGNQLLGPCMLLLRD